MVAKFRRRSLAFGLPGLFLQLLAYASVPRLAFTDPGMTPATLKWISIASEAGLLAGTVLFVVGMRYYAKAKGYGGALGFLGLFSWLGLLIIAFLPDRTVN